MRREENKRGDGNNGMFRRANPAEQSFLEGEGNLTPEKVAAVSQGGRSGSGSGAFPIEVCAKKREERKDEGDVPQRNISFLFRFY
jgi:hypothetical protein